MDFDTPIERRGTHCVKWDGMEQIYGVPADTGISMWVADMDFATAPVVQDAVQAMADHGVYGYFGDDSKYRAAIQWWMKERHGWDLDPYLHHTRPRQRHGHVRGCLHRPGRWRGAVHPRLSRLRQGD